MKSLYFLVYSNAYKYAPIICARAGALVHNTELKCSSHTITAIL